jgi:acyl-CoA synthetase (AMP-forming)/AMP-acid ligase II
MTGAATLAGAIHSWALKSPQQPAFRFPNRQMETENDLSWGELDDRSAALAVELSERGLSGRTVLLLCPGRREFVCAIAGCLYAGAIAVPAPVSISRRALPRILAVIRAAKPSAVIAPKALTEQPWCAEVIAAAALDVVEVNGPMGAKRVAPVSEPDRPALLQFTSGSTATPRGVLLSNGHLMANCSAIRQKHALGPHTRGIGWLPLHHDMGLIGHVLTAFLAGSQSFLLDPLLFLQRPLRWLELISRFAGTVTSAPNFAYEMCSRAAQKSGIPALDLSSLEIAGCGGEPVQADTIERFARTFSRHGFKKSAFVPCYGLAEATLLVCCDHVEESGYAASPSAAGGGPSYVSCGRPVASMGVRIVNPETAKPCADGEIGEIVVSGASVGALVTEWPQRKAMEKVNSGDLGFTASGRLYVTGRMSELIIVRGGNVFPQDIEQAVLSCDERIVPGGVAAFSVAADGTEGIVVAFEVARAQSHYLDLQRSISEAIAGCTGHVPKAVVPVALGRLPRTTSGKLQRRVIAQMYAAGELEPLSACEAVPADA